MIIFDENIEEHWIQLAKKAGLDYFSIRECKSGITDREVIEIAKSKKGLIVTEDKDFGELVVRLKKPHHGILLIRLAGFPSNEKATLAVNAISNHFKELKNAFSVLDHNKLRIRILE